MKTIESVLSFANEFEGVPYRWFIDEVDSFVGDDKLWCENSPPPTADEIRQYDKSVVCSGFTNILRRYCGLSIPGLNGNIRGKYAKLYSECPGGTGAWFLYLYQNQRLEKFDMKKKYPKGTLLIARFKSYIEDQGHVAIVFRDDIGNTIQDQLIIHAFPSIHINSANSEKNHGSVRIEPFHISNNLLRKEKPSYYTFVCLPENWLFVE
jgi:hypothetical protein